MLSQWLSPEWQYFVAGIMVAYTPAVVALALLLWRTVHNEKPPQQF
jgi:hypothetical protein